jgi:alpha 1,2-mannosyltransferase
MLQHDSWGEPLFVHYNLLKQIPSGIGRGFSWGRTKQLPLFNLWPASPSTARLGEPEVKPVDDDAEGLGEQDCDHLADVDEYGNARRKGKEMIMRRAARERGVKVRYHGGWISALWWVMLCVLHSTVLIILQYRSRLHRSPSTRS